MSTALGHIVIVEDDEDMRNLLRDYLTHEGYKTSCFSTASEAIQLIIKRNASPVADLLISDVLMTPIDGTELMRTVRAVYPSFPVILISSFGDGIKNQVEVEAVSNGSFHFVHKPFSFIEFKEIVREALKK